FHFRSKRDSFTRSHPIGGGSLAGTVPHLLPQGGSKVKVACANRSEWLVSCEERSGEASSFPARPLLSPLTFNSRTVSSPPGRLVLDDAFSLMRWAEIVRWGWRANDDY